MFRTIVVTGSDREEVRHRGLRALRETDIEGVPTTIPFHEQFLTDETFVAAEHTTNYVESGFEFDES